MVVVGIGVMVGVVGVMVICEIVLIFVGIDIEDGGGVLVVVGLVLGKDDQKLFGILFDDVGGEVDVVGLGVGVVGMVGCMDCGICLVVGDCECGIGFFVVGVCGEVSGFFVVCRGGVCIIGVVGGCWIGGCGVVNWVEVGICIFGDIEFCMEGCLLFLLIR